MEKQQAIRRIEKTFSETFDEKKFTEFLVMLFNDFNIQKASSVQSGNYIYKPYREHIHQFKRIGQYIDSENNKLDVLVVKVKNRYKLERTRTSLRNFALEYLDRKGDRDTLLSVFYADDSSNWRLSLTKLEYISSLDKSGKVKIQTKITSAKRYSFLVGQDEPCHTAKKQFLPVLQDTDNNPTLSRIEEIFNIEKVTKEFFNEYKKLFHKLEEEITRLLNKDTTIKKDFQVKNIKTPAFTKKLLGQIVFLYFIQKKGWLGVARNKNFGQGDIRFLRTLFSTAENQNKNYFNDYLEHLFYQALAIQRKSKDQYYYEPFHCRIPFLNGGLFEPMKGYDWKKTDIVISNEIFSNTEVNSEGDIGTGILDVFDRFNFTVKEDDPLDKEVAVDPEMLGKVFENLLEVTDRKSRGAFYTPREIVHYMCQESLINYLDTAVNYEQVPYDSSKQAKLFKYLEPGELPFIEDNFLDLVSKEDIETFIKNSLLIVDDERKDKKTFQPPNSIIKYAENIDNALQKLKICDPAIGSGAFPVGMLTEIVNARKALTKYIKNVRIKGRTSYNLKRSCIQNSLYGVDIDSSAIDIAKLRLWLSLMVEEDSITDIEPLPNLDYKIMQGNSLIEDFYGISLHIQPKNKETGNIFEEDNEQDKLVKKLHKKQDEYFDVTNTEEKNNKRNEVENLIVQIFHNELENQKSAYFNELKAIQKKSKSWPTEKEQQDYYNSEKNILDKKHKFNFTKIENELKEMTHGNKDRNFFPWKLYFADVFKNKGGFDVVIGNPPYVDSEEMVKTMPDLRKYCTNKFQSTKGNWDIYIPFFEIGIKYVHKNGILTFITPNKWLSIGYGKAIRSLLCNDLYQICRLDKIKVFEAGNSPVISFYKKEKSNGDIYIHEFNKNYKSNKVLILNQLLLAQDNWGILLSGNIKIVTKLCHNDKISDYYNVENPFATREAYEIKEYIKNINITDDELFFKFINTGTIDPYINLWGEKKLSYLGLKLLFPVINKKSLKEYSLRRYNQTISKKIIISGMRYFESFLDKKGNYIAGKSTIIVMEKDKYYSLESLIGIFNSKLMTFYINNVYSALGIDGGINFSKNLVNNLPIPQNFNKYQKIIANIVNKILKFKKNNKNYKIAPEEKLNIIIYKLYKLTFKESRIIDPEIESIISEKDYSNKTIEELYESNFK